ncbi:MAG: hypothetical protein WAV51_02880 [Microgenomates group bacterium]
MKKPRLFIIAIIIFLVLFSCHGVFSLYFLNDELLQMGAVQKFGILAGYLHVKTLGSILLGNGRVLGALLNGLFFYFFKDSAIPFAFFTIVIHTLNSYLAYLVAWKLTKNKNIAFITACVFAVPAAASQAFAWFGATTQTLGGMTFVLLALLLGIQGINEKKQSLRILAWFFAYIAFLFKESSFFVFPLLLLLPYVIKTKVEAIYWKKFAVITIVVLFFGVYKAFDYFGIHNVGSITPQTTTVVSKAVFQMGYFPLVSLGQFFIPSEFMHRFAPIFAKFNYTFMVNTTADDLATKVIVADLVSITLSFIFLIFIMIIYLRKPNYRKEIIFIAGWYVISFAPMAVFTYQRGTSYIESRYLYYSYFPVAMMIGYIVNEIRIYLEVYIKRRSITYAIMYVLLAIFIYKQTQLIQRSINENIAYGNEIKVAMSAIRNTYSTIPNKPIFYVEGDRKYFFDNNVLPFKLGSGYMLLLIFQNYPQISIDLIGENYLSKFFDQGYKEIGDKGFGYYWNKKDLFELFKANKDLSVEQVIGIYYYGDDKRVHNITQEIQNEIILHQRY